MAWRATFPASGVCLKGCRIIRPLTAVGVGVIRRMRTRPPTFITAPQVGDHVKPTGPATGLWLVKTQVSRYSLRSKGGDQDGKSRRCVRRRGSAPPWHEPVSGPGSVRRAVSLRQAGGPVRPPMGG